MAERPTDPPDPLQMLREHLRNAQDAAQRLVHEATETPPSGWEALDPEQTAQAAGQARALGELLHSLRDLLPDDVRAQLSELIGQLLAVLRALVDLLLSRLNRPPPRQSVDIQDIPII